MGSTVLVAEDDPEVLTTVALALEGRGLTVVRAETGAQLIQSLVEDGPFDLMVIDIGLPWMSGLQAARSARNAGLTMPILFITARQNGRMAVELSTLGNRTLLLRKPFELADLHRSVTSLLQPPVELGEP